MSEQWHILTSEYPPDVGGVSDYTKHVAEGLARAGDEVHVWCPRPADEGGAPNLHVHSDMGEIGPGDLQRIDRLLNRFPAPRRVLVQWVPHGFGYHSMNLWFCLWLARRAWRGDRVELMVHEPYLEFGRGPVRHMVMACVHRVMTMVLLAASCRVWMSIPAWEERLRPYALGRTLSMRWLPVPGCVSSIGRDAIAIVRHKYASEGQPLIGHFGTYGREVSALLEERLPAILDGHARPSVLLIGRGSEAFRRVLLTRNLTWASRVHATGYVSADELSTAIAACDLFVQPYPDGISSRRTSAMTCLASGRPVVTTRGHLTESLWTGSNAVVHSDVGDAASFVTSVERLLGDRDECRCIGDRGRQLYQELFSVEHIVSVLRAA